MPQNNENQNPPKPDFHKETQKKIKETFFPIKEESSTAGEDEFDFE